MIQIFSDQVAKVTSGSICNHTDDCCPFGVEFLEKGVHIVRICARLTQCALYRLAKARAPSLDMEINAIPRENCVDDLYYSADHCE